MRRNIACVRIAADRASQRPPLTQVALSGKLARIGVSLDRAAIEKIETDRRSVLDYEIRAFANVLHVKAESWLGGEE